MTNELELLREWGASITPTGAQIEEARALLGSRLDQEQVVRRQKARRSSHSSRISWARRPIVVGIAGVVLGAATAVAAVYQFSPERSLAGEGRQLVSGSLEQRRSVTSGDLTWTVFAYDTEDGLSCLTFDLTGQDGGQGLGSVGGCWFSTTGADLRATIGAVMVDGNYRQVLGGVVSEQITSVRAVADDGRVITDIPRAGTWIITPPDPARTWLLEALDSQDVVRQSIVVTEPDLAGD